MNQDNALTWEGQLKTLLHDWVVRLIKFGQAKIPEHGFYVFECPEAELFVRVQRKQAILSTLSTLEKMVDEDIAEVSRNKTHEQHTEGDFIAIGTYNRTKKFIDQLKKELT